MWTVTDVSAVRVATTNDANGNPRRGWIVTLTVDDERKTTWIEEGYRGRSAVQEDLPWLVGTADLVDGAVHINVQPKEYNRLRKAHGRG